MRWMAALLLLLPLPTLAATVEENLLALFDRFCVAEDFSRASLERMLAAEPGAKSIPVASMPGLGTPDAKHPRLDGAAWKLTQGERDIYVAFVQTKGKTTPINACHLTQTGIDGEALHAALRARYETTLRGMTAPQPNAPLPHLFDFQARFPSTGLSILRLRDAGKTAPLTISLFHPAR